MSTVEVCDAKLDFSPMTTFEKCGTSVFGCPCIVVTEDVLQV